MPMKLITILMLLALPLAASAQIPNGGFETLDGWHITEGPNNLKLSDDAYEGNFAGMIWSSKGMPVTLESHENYPFGGPENPGGQASPMAVKSFTGTYRYTDKTGTCSNAITTVLIFRTTLSRRV